MAECAAWAARRCGSTCADFIRRSQLGRVAAQFPEFLGPAAGLGARTRPSAVRALSPGAASRMPARMASIRSGLDPNRTASLDGK